MTATQLPFELRRPTMEDLAATLALMVRSDIDEYGEPDTDLEDLQHDWGTLDLAHDAWLAFSQAGELVGYGALIPGRSSQQVDIYLHPGWRQAGLAATLLARCLARAGERQQSLATAEFRLHTYLAHSNRHDRTLFEGAGFELVRHHFQMDIRMQSAPLAPDLPAGLLLRTAVPGQDDQAIHALIEAAFSRPGRIPGTLEQWRHHMMRSGSYDPDLWFLAVAGREIVGACLGLVYPEQGWVRQLGVADNWRRRGVATALLQRAFGAFFARGVRRVGLAVASDNPRACAFYERAGMTRLRQYDEYCSVRQPGG